MSPPSPEAPASDPERSAPQDDLQDDPGGASTEGRGLGGLVRHSAIYSAAPFLRQLISIGMVPLYTKWLGTAGVGVKEGVDLFLIGLQQLLGINVLSSMVRFYFDRTDQAERDRVVTSSTLIVTGAAWLVCGCALFFSPHLVYPILDRGGEVPASELGRILQLTLVLIPFQLSSMAGFYYLQILKRSRAFTTIQTTKLLVEVGFNFLFLGVMDMGVRGFLISMLIGEVLTTTGLTGWMLFRLRPRVDLTLMRPLLVYAWPMVLVGLCQLLLHFADRRILLAGPDGQSVNGIYGHGYKIAFLVTNMLLGPFIQIWQPWIFEVRDRHERGQLVARVGTYAVLTIATASLGVILLGRQAAILLSLDPDFWVAYRVIPWVSMAYVFWALYHVSQTVLMISKRTSRIFTINLVAVGVNLVANAYLIPILGFEGAAIATLITFVLLSIAMTLAARADGDIPFEVRRLGAILACCGAAGAFALWMDRLEEAGGAPVVLAIAAKLGVGLVLVGLLWGAVLRADERERFRRWAGDRLPGVRGGR